MVSAVRKRMPSGATGTKVGLVPLSEIRPSPENDDLYRPIDPKDPEIIALAESISNLGVLDPLVLTADGWIVSGHRRYVASKVAGLDEVPCRRLPLVRRKDPDRFLVVLREYNRQRDKTLAEKVREEVVSINPGEAHAELYAYRRSKAAVDVQPLEMGSNRKRKKISRAKFPMLEAIQKVLEDRRSFWPLSDRQIHYALLNDPPLIHASKSDSTYANNISSYKAVVDLLVRARLEGKIPFEAIADETRPVVICGTHADPRSFVRSELGDMFRGYYRDLMQSQPNHIELVGEKNTVGSILRPIALEYTIPLTTGRGYCSLPPRYEMAQRYFRSGKEKLVILSVSDFDPDGEAISKSFARSMRDEFGIGEDKVLPSKVALTAAQIERFQLPPMAKAKESSSRYKGFVDEHGDDVYELEALDPSDLQDVVREAIEAAIDREAYSLEIKDEQNDAAFLAEKRGQVMDILKDVRLGD